MTNEDVYVPRALQVPLHFAPGTRWRYSNTGYYLLQRIIEHITGRPYEETLTQQILRPAKLSSTLTPWQPKLSFNSLAEWYGSARESRAPDQR